ncbi:nucleoporin NUP116/NSP116, putative [Plasmodium gallinaceum]|uniref:Nucleoporin NUP116/NSP116, putative n=1 Tax=Plasmodium gallinaceum TaxID=5849 RepID=A0A1J1GUE6_PLAGA|nr:nucleoporin NUP116/NSP116, putative [Plasmodium gallinaceum]CRG94935.1 nucleoporin NUP116/NSP116, putative [Plasmodium gallinaceum]
MENKESIIIDKNKIKANDIHLNIKEWITSIEDCEAFFRNRKIMYFSDYLSKFDDDIKNKIENEEIIIICTVVNIPYKVRKYNEEKYIFWDISDLKETQSRLFLSGEICEENENEKEGVVVALINPLMKEKDPQYYNSRILEIHKKNNLRLIGLIDGLERCKGITKSGSNCKITLYAPLYGYYCKYHIKQNKTHKKRKQINNENDENKNDDKKCIKSIDIDTKDSLNNNDNYKKNSKKKKEEKDIDTEEYFDVESIIGMYSKKVVAKDKKKKIEIINKRIKELDDYAKLNKNENYLDAIKNDTMKQECSTQKSVNDIFSEQCPELIYLINKSNKITEKEENKNEDLKMKEDINTINENIVSYEEKQKRKFENFLSKLIELQKSKDENDMKTLLKGLIYVTNNFNFHLKHIENSNIFDICYKLMDHRNEEIAIAALKFKRKINNLYIDYYKNRLKKHKVETSGDKNNC